MKKILVAGGGFAGLSAAVNLVRSGHHVTLIESSRKFGGRAYSAPLKFIPALNESEAAVTEVDNGQHLLMGCYNYTLSFLKEIGTYNKLIIQSRLSVEYIDESGKSHFLSEREMFYPAGLLAGILKYDYLLLNDKLKLLKFLSILPFLRAENYSAVSVEYLLRKHGQTGKIYYGMWEPVTIGAMNCQPQKANAGLFIAMLKQIFLRDGFSSRIVVPAVPFRELYTEAAVNYIVKRGGEAVNSEALKELVIDGTLLKDIITEKRKISDFDGLILAVSPFSLSKITGAETLFPGGFPELSYSSITGIHIALKKPQPSERFAGLINSPVHWVFYKKDHISCIISDSNHLNDTDSGEIYSMTVNELEKRHLFRREEFTGYKVIKEKRATFIPDISNLIKRPSSVTPVKNILLAGDYTETGLPATIEGAVKSGVTAAELIIRRR